MGYHAVAMHVFCLFLDFPLVQCVAVLNVFVGTEALCLVVGSRFFHHNNMYLMMANWAETYNDIQLREEDE
jgi:hypothetical protein